MHSKQQLKVKSEKQLTLEVKMIDRMLANNLERGWISDEILQAALRRERTKARAAKFSQT